MSPPDRMEDIMRKRTLLAAVVTVSAVGIFSFPAVAGHCPRDVKLIDAALKTTSVDAATMTRVKALRDTGNEQHKSGRHGSSIANLHEAMKALGISH